MFRAFQTIFGRLEGVRILSGTFSRRANSGPETVPPTAVLWDPGWASVFSVKFVRIFGVFEFLLLNGPKPGKRFDAAEPFVSVLDLNFFGIYATRCFKLTIIIPFLRPLSRLVQFSTAPSLTVLKLKLLRLWPKISFYVRGSMDRKVRRSNFRSTKFAFPFWSLHRYDHPNYRLFPWILLFVGFFRGLDLLV